MERKVVSGVMLTMLLTSMSTLAFNIQPVTTDQNAGLLLETDKDVYVFGENVTIILTNIGTGTVEIGGYPAWQIYKYPEEEMVHPMLFAWLLWWLEPGESDVITWNQYNEFTQSQAEPGMYVVRDIPGWGLSAYFEIVAEEQWIPCVPLPDAVDLVFWTENRTAYIDLTMTFPDAGYGVSDWGTVVEDDFEIWVDSEMWDWTGPAALVITTYSHTYDLGHLEEGHYTFTFKAWGHSVKSIDFVIELEGDANKDGIVDIYDIAVVSAHWYPGPPIGPSGYDVNCDLNNDGAIDINDIGIVSSDWGQSR